MKRFCFLAALLCLFSAPALAIPPGTVSPEALKQLMNLPPGSEVEFQYGTTNDGSRTSAQEGKGVGAGATAEGDKLSQEFTGTPPKVGLGSDGAVTAEGGGGQSEQRASAVKLPPIPWANPMFWIGLVCLGLCGFGVYSGLRRFALVTGVAGASLLAVSFFPIILYFVIAGIVGIIVVPYAYAEYQKRQAEAEANRQHEALRAVVAGVEHKDIPAPVQSAVKAAIAKEADGADREAIDEVKRADKIGKYAD